MHIAKESKTETDKVTRNDFVFSASSQIRSSEKECEAKKGSKQTKIRKREEEGERGRKATKKALA